VLLLGFPFAAVAVWLAGADPIKVTELTVVFSAIAQPLTCLPILIVVRRYVGDQGASAAGDCEMAERAVRRWSHGEGWCRGRLVAPAAPRPDRFPRLRFLSC
jgi:hypothetical protein